MQNFRNLFFTFVVSLVFLACAKPQSAFFDTQTSLKPISETQRYEKVSDENLSEYTKIIVPNVVFLRKQEDAGVCQESALITSYATTAYRKKIRKSNNYTLVDVPQEKSITIEIALSLVKFDALDVWETLQYSDNELKGSHLMIESKTYSSMDDRVLVRSQQIILDEAVDELSFRALQTSLDKWLYE